MPDQAHRETDKELEKMERKLRVVYGQAAVRSQQKANRFFEKFAELDRIKKQQVKEGKLDQETYLTWRRNKMAMGENYRAMVDTLTSDMMNANQLAASIINGHLPEVYANNYNFGTYQIEHDSQINTSFTLYDRQTVERLMRDNPDLIPIKARVDIPKDKLWNKQKINSVITQSILTGDSIPDIAKSLQKVAEMNKVAAVRSARTATTSAQNGGRVDSYKRAQTMGIKLRQQWMATLDGRTRDTHRALDGEIIAVAKDKWHPAKFSNGCRFPGDPQGPGHEIYNCRCTLIGVVDGVDFNLSDVTQRDSKLGAQSYDEWKAGHKKKAPVKPITPAEPAKPPQPAKPTPKPVADTGTQTDTRFGEQHAAPGSAEYNPYNIRDQLGDDFVDAMETILNFASREDIAEVYFKYGPKVRILSSNFTGTAHFDADRVGIRMDAKSIATGSSIHNPYQTAFHEMAHNIDYIAGEDTYFTREYKDGLLEKTLKSDYEKYRLSTVRKMGPKMYDMELVGNALQEIGGKGSDMAMDALRVKFGTMSIEEAWDKYGDELAGRFTSGAWKDNADYQIRMFFVDRKIPDRHAASLSDAIEAQTGYGLGMGHSTDYWRKAVSTNVDPTGYESTHKQPLEFFAEYLDGNMSNPVAVGYMREVFPNACDVCDEIIKEMLK